MTRKSILMAKNFDFFTKLVLRVAQIQQEQAPNMVLDLHPFDKRNIHPKIDNVCRHLFDNGHYSQSTFEAFKLLEKQVSAVSNINESGQKLMMKVFNENSPAIKLTNLSNTSEIDEQKGFMFLFAGSSSAIRNPRGHEVGNIENIEKCLDHLSLASFLLRRINERVSP